MKNNKRKEKKHRPSNTGEFNLDNWFSLEVVVSLEVQPLRGQQNTTFNQNT